MNNDDPPRPKSTRSTSHRRAGGAQPLFATARALRLIRGFVPFFCENERRAPDIYIYSAPRPSISLSGGRDASAIESRVCFEKVMATPTRAASAKTRRELFFTRKNVQSARRSLILNRPISPITDINIADSALDRQLFKYTLCSQLVICERALARIII